MKGAGPEPGQVSVGLDPPTTWPPFLAPAGACIGWPGLVPNADPGDEQAQVGRRSHESAVHGGLGAREYDGSMATLRPLLARIEETDRPRDEIVYRHRGLTDAEIDMVE